MFFVFKHNTAYEFRSSDWSSDVCSADLPGVVDLDERLAQGVQVLERLVADAAVSQEVVRDLPGVFQVVGRVRQRELTAVLEVAHFNVVDRRPGGSAERRAGTEYSSPCSYRWSPYHSNNNSRDHEA